ncbi:MAG: hypothetical protein WB643_13910 [Candidatus Bathyarchaeia archaeon]
MATKYRVTWRHEEKPVEYTTIFEPASPIPPDEIEKIPTQFRSQHLMRCEHEPIIVKVESTD